MRRPLSTACREIQEGKQRSKGSLVHGDVVLFRGQGSLVELDGRARLGPQARAETARLPEDLRVGWGCKAAHSSLSGWPLTPS